MNKSNYCTLEAAKHLHDAGIEIETEAAWAMNLETKEWLTSFA